MVYNNLKSLIKGIRACKTVADERALIQQESAAIRASFREEDSFQRYNNIAKLLYIHMLGSPAHFGQIECLKLVASPRFIDKRLGYLGIMLLLDENQEVLTLVTNSLKNDMNHSNMYTVGLALCTFANIASEEINTYIRKKAALCALRVVKKVPDLVDHFVSKAKSLLTDRNHGVLLAAITLVSELCHINEALLNEFRDAVPILVRNLKSLVTTGYSPEHDLKVLRLLRMLGKGDVNASEIMNDILAQVATNTDSTKNVGNSILYETYSGLRVMAINILGKFLSNRDNNIRYVALNTLNKVVSMDTNAVQRHRNTILDCLRDGDISIRRRALELSYALINEQNVRILVRELLAFLEIADDEFKQGMTTQICLAAERYAPNKRWHIDTVLRVLKLAGNFVREEILSAFIRLVAHTPELQHYTASKLFLALKADISQESLTIAATWVLGEYSEIILEGGELVDLILSTLDSPYANSLTRQYTLASITKMSSRPTTSQTEQDRIHETLTKYATSPELELQQRAVEFAGLFNLGSVREGVLERMPPPELKATVMDVVSEKKPVGSTKASDLLADEASPLQMPANGPTTSTQTNQDLLAEIFGSTPRSTVDDILGLFGSTTSTSVAPVPTPVTASTPSAFSFSQTQSSPPPPTPSQAASRLTAYTAYDQNGLKVTLTPQTTPAKPGIVMIQARFQVTGGSPVSSINFQAAVPKAQQLQMLPMSSSNVDPGAVETQQMRVIAPVGSTVRLRLRISYTINGQTYQDQVDFSSFPAGLTAGNS
ncbi:gamma-adaptin [Amanita rubescens]|nr:gamma-adaptin [Amanita rubescens]